MRFSTRLTDLKQSEDRRRADRHQCRPVKPRVLKGRYVIGTDGAGAPCAGCAEIEFEGFTWPERIHQDRHDVRLSRTDRGYCTRNYFSDPDEWLNLFKVKGNGGKGIWRGIFPVPADEPDESAMSVEGVQRRLQESLPKSGDYDISYHALYGVHQRVAQTYNKGPRLPRRRQRAREQSDRRHGHERRHP